MVQSQDTADDAEDRCTPDLYLFIAHLAIGSLHDAVNHAIWG